MSDGSDLSDDGRERRVHAVDRRKFLLGGAFLATGALAYAREPRTFEDFLGRAKLDDIIPKNVGPWSYASASGLVTAPEDQLSRLLYSQLVTRVYSSETQPAVMFLVAQSAKQTGVLQIHRPEVCYPAGGFQLSPVIEHAIPLAGGGALRTNLLSATADDRIEHIVYWTRVGNHLPVSWAQQRWAVAQDNLNGIVPDAVLARISIVHPNREEAVAVIDAFTRSLFQVTSPLARRVLVGGA